MKRVKFKLNLKGLNEIMKSEEMQAVLAEAGKQVAASAGNGYESDVHTASFVSIANVYPNTFMSAKRNWRENTLLKAIGSVGLSMQKGGR